MVARMKPCDETKQVADRLRELEQKMRNGNLADGEHEEYRDLEYYRDKSFNLWDRLFA